jgi:biotin synthase-like enzyme
MDEELDYYFNSQGLMVFTAAYHLKRGYCCKNGCKHCPWSYGKNKGLKSSKPTINQLKTSSCLTYKKK